MLVGDRVRGRPGTTWDTFTGEIRSFKAHTNAVEVKWDGVSGTAFVAYGHLELEKPLVLVPAFKIGDHVRYRSGQAAPGVPVAGWTVTNATHGYIEMKHPQCFGFTVISGNLLEADAPPAVAFKVGDRVRVRPNAPALGSLPATGWRIVGRNLLDGLYECSNRASPFELTLGAEYLELELDGSKEGPVSPTSRPARPTCPKCQRELSATMDAYYGRDPEAAKMCAPCRG